MQVIHHCCERRDNLRYYIHSYGVRTMTAPGQIAKHEINAVCPKHAGVLMFNSDTKTFTTVEEAELWLICNLMES